MQANVEVGETSTITNVCRIEIELQRIINMIKDQKKLLGKKMQMEMLILMFKLIEVEYCTLLIIINCPTHSF
jgi:hypothetical protein